MKASIRLTIVAILGLSALVMAGCGNAKSTKNQLGVDASGNSTGAPPLPSNAASTLNPVNGIPQQALSALLGNYGGSLVANNESTNFVSVTQNYAFSLAQNTANGQNYVYLNFNSGSMAFNTYLSLQPSAGQMNPGSTSFEVVYDFISPVINVSSISPGPIAIYVQIALQNGNTFDPAQSMISILDCGLSQGVSCTGDLYGIAFNNDLGKR